MGGMQRATQMCAASLTVSNRRDKLKLEIRGNEVMLHQYQSDEFWVPISLLFECVGCFMALLILALVIAAMMTR